MITVCTHWGNVKTARRGVQSMQAFYVDDKFVGTRVEDVKALMPKGFTWKQTRAMCDAAKWDGSNDYVVYQDDGKWAYKKVMEEA